LVQSPESNIPAYVQNIIRRFCSAQQTYNCADGAYVWEKLVDDFMEPNYILRTKEKKKPRKLTMNVLIKTN
jgi:hypothetical protein